MKKKILIVTKYFPPEYGGIESLAKKICDMLLKKRGRFKFDVLCHSKYHKKKEKLDNLTVYRFKEDINIFSTPISLNYIKFLIMNKQNYDVIHLFTPNPFPSFLLLFFKPKNLIISWGSDIINQKILKFFFKPFQTLLLKRASKIICLSSTYRNSSLDLENFIFKSKIIPPLCNSNLKFVKKNFHTNKINILSVGRLVDYKNYETSILSLKYLPDQYNLTIIGNGKLKNHLNYLIAKNFLNKRVKILTNLNDYKKNKFYKTHHIFLQSSNSRAESFGISILEALSNSMPLIIANVSGSGMNDMINDKYNGFKFKRNNPQDCAKKIQFITKKNFNILRKNSLRLFYRKFNPKIITSKLEKIYDL